MARQGKGGPTAERTAMIKITIVGTRPLLMHNGRLNDQLDPYTKKLSVAAKKKGKSGEELGDVSRIEFEGSMYFDEKVGPYLPVDNLQACMIEGARKRKLGKDFESLVEVNVPDSGPEGYPLQYKGPRTVDALWDSRFMLRKGARVGQSRVMRTRPRFPTEWKCSFEVDVLDGGPSPDQVKQAFVDAGKLIGIGDWSPRYGRFVVDTFKA